MNSCQKRDIYKITECIDHPVQSVTRYSKGSTNEMSFNHLACETNLWMLSMNRHNLFHFPHRNKENKAKIQFREQKYSNLNFHIDSYVVVEKIGDDALKERTSFRIGDRSNEKLKSAPPVKGSIVFRVWLDDIRKKLKFLPFIFCPIIAQSVLVFSEKK